MDNITIRRFRLAQLVYRIYSERSKISYTVKKLNRMNTRTCYGKRWTGQRVRNYLYYYKVCNK